VSEQLPAFDDEWVAAARHREASVAELDELRSAERRQDHRARRRISFRRTIGLLVLLGCLAGFAWYVVIANSRSDDTGGQFVDHVGNAQFATISDARPTPTAGTEERLLPAVTADDPTATHAFIATRDDGTPVTYDPCRPVQFAVNPVNAPPEYLRIIDEVLTTASAATGLQLLLVDDTTEVPSMTRPLFQPDRYGDQWAPILIAWTDETAIPELAGRAGGLGGSSWSSDGPGSGWFVSGMLYIDIDVGPDPERNRIVMIHELGHVLGLSHVDDPTQVMNPSSVVAELGAGDRAGFARVGAGDCAGEL
jgi:Matrixin